MNNQKLTRIECKGYNFITRDGTSDQFVVREVVKGNAYRKLNIYESDIVLDIGLNIGCFSVLASNKAKYVHSYEPEKQNFDLAKINVKINAKKENYTLNNLAVIGNDDETRDFSINVKKNKGAHSLVAKRGRDSVTVKCININKIIKEINPDVIKMDIEGGEYECLKAIETFGKTREFIMEFHHAHLNDIYSREKYTELIDILKKHFKNIDYREHTKKAWVTNVYCYN